MKKVSSLFALLSIGLVLVSCRQSSFIAEDDVYSSGSSYTYTNDNSDASYANYVYSKESNSGTKAAYYNPEDTVYNDNNNTYQSGTVINNYYYGNDYRYYDRPYSYSSWGSPYYSYRPYRVWWGWGYDPFWGGSSWYYGWNYSPYSSWGWGYGHHPYGYGYNPYAWNYGYGYNPYGYGYGGYGGYYGGVTNIYGNVYINNGGAGMTPYTLNAGGYYQKGNSYVGKRPVMAGTSAPYTGANKVKSAINPSTGKPMQVDKAVNRKPETSTLASKTPGKVSSNTTNSNFAAPARTERLTSSAKPWTPETERVSTSSKGSNTDVRRVNGTLDRNVAKPATNSPRVPANSYARPNTTSQPATNNGSDYRRNDNQINRTPSSRPAENQWNRNNTSSPAPGRTSSPTISRPASSPSNGRPQSTAPSREYKSPSSSPSRGGSYSPSSRPSKGSYSAPSSSPSRGSYSSPSRSNSSGSSSGSGSSRPSRSGISRP